SLLPCSQRIVPRWHALNFERPAVVADAIRPFYHHHVTAHPRMNVAFHVNRNFFRWPRSVDRRSARGLGFVPLVIWSSRFRHGVGIVRRTVAVGHLEVLIHIQSHNVRNVLASMLVPVGTAGNRSLGSA